MKSVSGRVKAPDSPTPVAPETGVSIGPLLTAVAARGRDTGVVIGAFAPFKERSILVMTRSDVLRWAAT
jgi:hypothetical protein